MLIFGVDEVGCSSLTGPVITCAVAIDDSMMPVNGVKDSKQLTKKKMRELFPILDKIPHAYGAASKHEVEKLNLYWARYLAMKRAVDRLIKKGYNPDKVLVDGNRIIPDLSYVRQEAHIKGDQKFWEISAASILAKVTRDKMMSGFSKLDRFSYYGFETNAGYYSKIHKKGIVLHGPTAIHRKTFNLVKYCIRSREEFLSAGKTAEDYFLWEEQQLKPFEKEGQWEPVKYDGK